MSLTEPYDLRILQDLQTALRAIQGTAAGYYYTVASDNVRLDPHVNLLTLSSTELPIVLIEPDGRDEFKYEPAMRVRRMFPVDISAAVDAGDDDLAETAKTTAWERLVADIERAVTRDITRGGLAIDTRVTERRVAADVGSGRRVQVLVVVQVSYIRTYGNPQET